MYCEKLSHAQRDVMATISGNVNEALANLFSKSLNMTVDDYLEEPFIRLKSNSELASLPNSEDGMIVDLLIGKQYLQFLLMFDDNFLSRLNDKSSNNIQYMSHAMLENIYTTLINKSDDLFDQYVYLSGTMKKNEYNRYLNQFVGSLFFIEMVLSTDYSVYNSSSNQLNSEFISLIVSKMSLVESKGFSNQFGHVVCDICKYHMNFSYNLKNTNITSQYMQQWIFKTLSDLFKDSNSWLSYSLLFLWDKLLQTRLTFDEYGYWVEFVKTANISSHINYSVVFGTLSDILSKSNPKLIKAIYALD